MNNLPLFELRSVSKSYGEEAVVDQLSLSLHTGEIFGLLGESGAGKSTLLQLAANLINPDLGEVWLGGEKLPLPSDLLIPGHPDIKIVHQDYGLSPNLSVRENIRYALRYYEKNFRDARIEELLELCQLQAQAEQPAKLLSGGEKQRTAIARALAEEAQILLLDEPFAHLDLLNNRRLAETIRKSVALSGAACIFVTHHATDALGLSQRMGILQQGSLIQVGTPQEIYHQPLNAYVAGLSGEANVLDLTLATQYFGRHDWHVLPDAQVLIRPEYLHVQATPGADGLKAEVRWSIFEGSRYRVCVRLGQFDLMVYSDKAVKEKQEVGISVV